MIRVAAVADHPIVLWGVEYALGALSDIDLVCTTTATGLNVRDVDVLLLDYGLDDESSSALIAARSTSLTNVVVMSATNRAEDIARCMQLGVRGYIHKGATREEFTETIRTAATGAMAFPSVENEWRPPTDGLSPRERQVISFIGAGMTHEQTARRLGISKHTVDTYVKRVRAKLNLGNKAELARLALTGVATGDGR